MILQYPPSLDLEYCSLPLSYPLSIRSYYTWYWSFTPAVLYTGIVCCCVGRFVLVAEWRLWCLFFLSFMFFPCCCLFFLIIILFNTRYFARICSFWTLYSPSPLFSIVRCVVWSGTEQITASNGISQIQKKQRNTKVFRHKQQHQAHRSKSPSNHPILPSFYSSAINKKIVKRGTKRKREETESLIGKRGRKRSKRTNY